MTHLKATAAALALFCALAIGAGLLAQQARTDQPARPAAKPLAPAVKALIEARLETAREIYLGEMPGRDDGFTDPPVDDLASWSRRWLNGEVQLHPARGEWLAAIEAHLERARNLENLADARAERGVGQHSIALRAKYYRLEAEQMLAEAKSAVGDATPPTMVKPEPATPGRPVEHRSKALGARERGALRVCVFCPGRRNLDFLPWRAVVTRKGQEPAGLDMLMGR